MALVKFQIVECVQNRTCCLYLWCQWSRQELLHWELWPLSLVLEKINLKERTLHFYPANLFKSQFLICGGLQEHWFVPCLLYPHTQLRNSQKHNKVISTTSICQRFLSSHPLPALRKPQTSSHNTFQSKDPSSRQHRCWDIDFWTLECLKVKASCKHLIIYQVSTNQRAGRGHR